jgi:hypothetical protein
MPGSVASGALCICVANLNIKLGLPGSVNTSLAAAISINFFSAIFFS